MTTENTSFTMKLQVVPLPVTDIDRTKAFYAEKVGFNLDHDVQPNEHMRVVQLTPHGSDCSIVFGKGMAEIDQMTPGTIKGLHLVIDDMAVVRDALIARGVDMGEIIEFPGGMQYAGFSDPDGNLWVLQEIPAEFKKE